MCLAFRFSKTAMFPAFFCFSEAASLSHSSYKAASHCSDGESSGFEQTVKFPEDLMEAFLNSCLDEHMAYERIQWVATVWPPGNGSQETEVETAEVETTAEREELWVEIDLETEAATVENEVSTAENEEVWVEIDLENEVVTVENEVSTAENKEMRNQENEGASSETAKPGFRKRVKDFFCYWCCICGK